MPQTMGEVRISRGSFSSTFYESFGLCSIAKGSQWDPGTVLPFEVGMTRRGEGRGRNSTSTMIGCGIPPVVVEREHFVFM